MQLAGFNCTQVPMPLLLMKTGNLTKAPAHARSVNCPKCEKEFCSSCSGNWHAGMTCQEYGKMLVKNHGAPGAGAEPDTLLMIEGDIKRCPMCQVPIERDAGCAQMMCKRCKHVFCWFCLTSLDVSFQLHYHTHWGEKQLFIQKMRL